MGHNAKDDEAKIREDGVNVIYDTARDEKVSELDILRQSLEEKKTEACNYYDQLLRLKAEFDNYRRRVEKEKQNHLLWGKEDVLQKQLMLVDVLEQANQSIRGATNIESIKKGIELIYQEFLKMLCSEGVSEIECLEKKFDPHIEEAIEQVESEKEEGTVIEVMQKGYCLNGKVLRPAKVKVAQGTKSKEKKDS